MKKVVTLLLLCLMLTTLLTGCDCSHEYDSVTDIHCNDCGYDRLEGTWTTTIENAPGEMTLYCDGTGTVTSHDIPRDCTWEIVDNTLTVVQEANGFYFEFLKNVSFQLEENTLTVTSQSGNTLVFTKK